MLVGFPPFLASLPLLWVCFVCPCLWSRCWCFLRACYGCFRLFVGCCWASAGAVAWAGLASVSVAVVQRCKGLRVLLPSVCASLLGCCCPLWLLLAAVCASVGLWDLFPLLGLAAGLAGLLVRLPCFPAAVVLGLVCWGCFVNYLLGCDLSAIRYTGVAGAVWAWLFVWLGLWCWCAAGLYIPLLAGCWLLGLLLLGVWVQTAGGLAVACWVLVHPVGGRALVGCCGACRCCWSAGARVLSCGAAVVLRAAVCTTGKRTAS